MATSNLLEAVSVSDRLRIEVVGAGSISSISLPGIFPHLTQEDI